MFKDNVVDSGVVPQDDLKEIDGIGPGYARALHKIGVDTFAKLAKYVAPVDLRQDLIEQAKVDVPLWKIENRKGSKGSWLHQAKTLAGSKGERYPIKKKTEAKSTGKWEEYAGFMIFFDTRRVDKREQNWQTRVYRTENGDQDLFPGIEPTPWVKWIVEQAQLPIEFEEIVGREEGIDIKIEVDLDEDPYSSVVEKKLTAMVALQISGLEGSTLMERPSSFFIELWLVEPERQISELVATIDGQLMPQTFTCSREAQFAMPLPGRYELHTLLLLPPPNEKLISHIGPIINVVPELLNVEAVPV